MLWWPKWIKILIKYFEEKKNLYWELRENIKA